jgi:hypothetical protein
MLLLLCPVYTPKSASEVRGRQEYELQRSYKPREVISGVIGRQTSQICCRAVNALKVSLEDGCCLLGAATVMQLHEPTKWV